MGDRSPIIYSERKKRRMAAKAKEAKALLDSENSVVFKIKTNAPQRYVVKPHKGSIGPSDTVTSVITLLPFNFKETEKYPDKFLIQVSY